MKKAGSVLRTVIILLVCLIEVYPLFWMLTASFKQQYEWSEKPAYALNSGFYFQNYEDAWTRGHMSTYFKNSLITTLVSLVFIVVFSCTVGFAVTKMRWKMREAIARYFQFGIMIPVAVAGGTMLWYEKLKPDLPLIGDDFPKGETPENQPVPPKQLTEQDSLEEQ